MSEAFINLPVLHLILTTIIRIEKDGEFRSASLYFSTLEPHPDLSIPDV